MCFFGIFIFLVLLVFFPIAILKFFTFFFHFQTYPSSQPPLGGHLTFQILTLLRYVVDIGLDSSNPKFF